MGHLLVKQLQKLKSFRKAEENKLIIRILIY